MQTSVSWLRELVPQTKTSDELADELTAIGTAVQWVKPLWSAKPGLRAVRVVASDPHPKADRLSVCRIDSGNGEQTLVCGAPNVRAGMMAVWVPPGATLPDGTVIEKRPVRGVESAGMLCSEAELGLSHMADTIVELPSEITVGTPAEELFNDDVIAFELTPNRPDCLATFGIAREVAALIGEPFRIPEFQRGDESEALGDAIDIRIEDPEGCPRYAAMLIEGLTVAPSPWWLKQRVLACGMRPINNIVDVTNFVMMETGQPLHAFDYDKFDRLEIVVRASRAGETFTTLDEKKHELPDEVVLITDGAKTIALGGVMGGLNSEVDDSTTTVLLESAYFNPRRTRRTRKALGIDSEAALRFEKGTDPNMVPYALDRAAHLLAKLGGGSVRKGTIDVYPDPIVPRSLTLRVARTNQILGLSLTAKQMAAYLRSISLQADPSEAEVKVRVPTFRPDLEREIDLVEEVARLHGYEDIPVREQGGGRLFDVPDHDPATETIIHRHFSSRGFNEVVTNSMGSESNYRVFEPDLAPARIANPLSEELSHMRTGLLADLVATAVHNFNHRNLDWRLYTLGTVFLPAADPKPHEELHLGLALAGSLAPRFWLDSGRPAGWYDLKGAIGDLFAALRLPPAQYKATARPGLLADACFAVLAGEDEVGVAGRLDARAAKPWDVKETLWLAELRTDLLAKLRGAEPIYQPLPRFPATSRDLALVVADEVQSSALMATLRQTAGPLLSYVELFDLYRGKPLPAGRKSLAFNLVFQSQDRSLEAEEVDDCIRRALQAAQTRHGAELRS